MNRSTGSSSSWADGTVVPGSRYEVVRTLGSGGMGTVYEVRHRDLGLVRALKVLAPRLAQRPDLVERLEREARVLAQLRGHPHLVEVVDFGRTDDGRPYYVMERLLGKTLRQYADKRALPFPEACGLVLQLLAALSPVHDAGVVHRDVKPDNVFVQDEGRCKLLDFGVMKAMVDGISVAKFMTAPGSIVGTARYICPEYIGQKTPDARADVYAAGVVLFELLVGQLPWAELNEDDFLARVLRRGLPSLDEVGAMEVPEEIRHVVTRATAYERDARFASADSFAAELAWALVRLGTGFSASARSGSFSERGGDALAAARRGEPKKPLVSAAPVAREAADPAVPSSKQTTAPARFETVTRPPRSARPEPYFLPPGSTEPLEPLEVKTPPPWLSASSRGSRPPRLDTEVTRTSTERRLSVPASLTPSTTPVQARAAFRSVRAGLRSVWASVFQRVRSDFTMLWIGFVSMAVVFLFALIKLYGQGSSTGVVNKAAAGGAASASASSVSAPVASLPAPVPPEEATAATPVASAVVTVVGRPAAEMGPPPPSLAAGSPGSTTTAPAAASALASPEEKTEVAPPLAKPRKKHRKPATNGEPNEDAKATQERKKRIEMQHLGIVE